MRGNNCHEVNSLECEALELHPVCRLALSGLGHSDAFRPYSGLGLTRDISQLVYASNVVSDGSSTSSLRLRYPAELAY